MSSSQISLARRNWVDLVFMAWGMGKSTVWDEHADPFTKTVPVTVGRLRRKLGDPPPVETVIGGGYRIS